MSDLIKEIGTSDVAKPIIDRFHDDYWKFISCGMGWLDLILSCDSELASIDPNYKIYQVKEKFGSLRFYYSTEKPEESERMNEIVRNYEIKSLRVCESTGEEASIVSKRGYFKTLSPEVAERLGYEQGQTGA
jgi:hypothetical protein